ncbi:MAG TPA: extracellular solute-binding protein [Tepidisphaeraceae bacterium]|nr:extracellular solute-binding protein [Tepidisphaeraceae bacterium]
MAFHLGKPVLAMMVIAVSSGMLMLLMPPAPRAEMKVWVFADSHSNSYRTGINGKPSLVEQYRQKTGVRVEVSLIAAKAEDVRLMSLFSSDSANVPDLAEVEIGSVGKFFIPPVREVGFLPLNEFLERDGLLEKMVPSRFAPWSKEGVIFGVPHDVHPVTISYRKDLFDEVGVDLASARTWDVFQEMCLKAQERWRRKGFDRRYALEMPQAKTDYLVTMLLQRHINLIDDHNRVYLNDPKVADTVARYALMVEGRRRIGTDSTPGVSLWTRDLANGDFCACFTPDWRSNYIRTQEKGLAGKVAMMRLPVFEAGDEPTGTWGGTMIGIPRRCRNPEESWKLLKFLYTTPQSLEARLKFTNIIPPMREQWADPMYHRADPFFGGQKVDELYIELADRIPKRYVTPFTPMAVQSLSFALGRAVAHVEDHGEAGLREVCQAYLDRQAEDLKKRIAFGTFE